jgi:hypothetical protein
MATDGDDQQDAHYPPFPSHQLPSAPRDDEGEQNDEAGEGVGHDLTGEPGQAAECRESREEHHEPAGRLPYPGTPKREVEHKAASRPCTRGSSQIVCGREKGSRTNP